MKVIFLDFDGVINSTTFMMRIDGHKGHEKISEEMVGRVNRIIEETGAEVVVSSTWRKLHDLDELQKFLDKNGFVGELMDKTPPNFGMTERGDIIQLWLDEHPFVEEFVVIDDDTDMTAIPDENFINTDTTVGITNEHVEEAIDILSS